MCAAKIGSNDPRAGNKRMSVRNSERRIGSTRTASRGQGEEPIEQQNTVAQVIAGWQEKLLQLDRRNNLLYFKPGRSAVPLRGISPEVVDNWLGSSKARWKFAHVEQGGAGVREMAGDIEADVEPAELQRRLAVLRRRDREWDEEQGLNVLFLAIGFLRWIDNEGVEARSPLALLPCDLERASPSAPFYLKREDDLAEANVTLAHQLQAFGIELPDLQEQRLAEYLRDLSQAVCERADWSVTADIVLSTFAYSKLAMYEDLDRMRTGGVEHPLVLQLAGETPRGSVAATGSPTPSALPEVGILKGGRLDDLLDLRDQFIIIDADFSQLRAIEIARRGDSHLVVHGPPGTGKSQTIVNLIATLLADGKRVLFVSEKTAALDVVKRRLDECGLGVFCLDMHSERARKSSVYQQLHASLQDPRYVRNDTPLYEELQDRRDSLNRYVRALHKSREPLGRSAFQIQGQYAQVQHLPAIRLKGRAVQDMIKGLDATRWARIDNIAGRIARRTEEFRAHGTSRWIPLTATRFSMGLHDRIRNRMRSVIDAVDMVTSRIESISEWTGVPAPATAAACDTTADFLDHLSRSRGVPSHWLDRGVLARLDRLALERAQQQTQRRALEAVAGKSFGGSRPKADYRSIASELQCIRTDT